MQRLLSFRFVSELGKIEDQKKTDGNAPSSSTGEKRSTSKSTPIPSAPGDGSYAEVAAEPPSSTSSAVVSDRSGLSERRTTRSQGQTQSSSNQSSSSRSSDNNNNTSAGEETYAQIAAEAPDSSNNVVRQDKTGRSVNNQSKSARDVGVVEAAGMSYINKNNNNNQEGGSYADAAAEDPDPQESVVREDRVGRTETK